MARKFFVENLLNDTNKDWNIYRIIPFERLVEIFTEKKLTLISPLKWEDPFEKYWMEVLYPDTKQREKNINSIFGLCFSTDGNSDALWRIYSPNMLGVRIKINLRKLIFELEKTSHQSGQIFIGNVNYRPDKDLVSFSKSILTDRYISDEMTIRPWLNKRKAFSHEKEIRLLYVNRDEAVNQKDIIQFSIDPKNLISSIQIDPRTSFGLAEALRSHLKELTGISLQSLKQSELYKLPTALRKK